MEQTNNINEVKVMMAMAELGFASAEQAAQYVKMRDEKSEAKELYKQLQAYVPVQNEIEVKITLRSLHNGYENQLYRDLIAYANEHKMPDYSESMVMQRVFNKVVELMKK